MCECPCNADPVINRVILCAASPPYNYAVATSKSALGPFAVISTNVSLTTQFGSFYNDSNVGDFSLFVDDDGAGYILYSSNAHCQVRVNIMRVRSIRMKSTLRCFIQIEPLTDDYLASAWLTTGRTSGILPHGNEAPAMFKRGLYYYALVSDSCCFCGQVGVVPSVSLFVLVMGNLGSRALLTQARVEMCAPLCQRRLSDRIIIRERLPRVRIPSTMAVYPRLHSRRTSFPSVINLCGRCGIFSRPNTLACCNRVSFREIDGSLPLCLGVTKAKVSSLTVLYVDACFAPKNRGREKNVVGK